ncbi:MAG: acyl-CoA dehydrogenase family protein [Candidatus Poribacteria bacterium]|nr:acyl-CoA dehydrogenase family protein [Candidatus Poribacteria bacterium]
MNATERAQIARGGGFLIEDASPQAIYTPEDFSDAHTEMAQDATAFMEREIFPHTEAIEARQEGLIAQLLKKAGKAGLLAINIPRAYDGLGRDLITSLLVTEKISLQPSFHVAYAVHNSIGTLPLVYFGTEAQKRKYLPRLASGEMIGAFALTERGSGSDALSATTHARLSEDGKYYILNGEKMWIGNADCADLFTVFAQVDGIKFTAFLVEGNSAGLSTGNELTKMGIRGVSNRPVCFENVKVPVENVLGEIGRGHLIAFNILNVGRLRLSAGCAGTAKSILKTAVTYAKKREQFGKPIAEFGLIQHKIGEMATRIYVGESMVYRAAGDMSRLLNAEPNIKGLEEYAIECSILKVAGSEILDYVADEGVQVFGGYGFSEEYPMARSYRDARINRIFEGTNEINRLFIPTMLMRRMQQGRLPIDALRFDGDSQIAGCKKTALYLCQKAAARFGDGLVDQQEILGYISDIIIEIYAIESAMLRTQKLIERVGEKGAQVAIDMTQTYTNDALPRIQFAAQQAFAAIRPDDADTLPPLQYSPIDTVLLRRRIARQIIVLEEYKIP